MTETTISETNRRLVHRINRIQGQLEAIKKGLEKNESKDCTRTMQLLKAANHAMKKFGEAYIAEHMAECLSRGKAPDEMEKEMKAVISSAFSM